MNDHTLKVALVGCGRIAGHHCRSIAHAPGMGLAATCDLDIEKAQAYGEKFDVPYFSNYRQMFEQVSNIDIVAIITPSGMHFEHASDV